jgi:hypothetical protein
MLRLPGDGADALKHGGVLIKHFNIYVCACVDLINSTKCTVCTYKNCYDYFLYMHFN